MRISPWDCAKANDDVWIISIANRKGNRTFFISFPKTYVRLECKLFIELDKLYDKYQKKGEAYIN